MEPSFNLADGSAPLTDDAKALISMAESEARRYGHGSVNSAHILLCITLCNQNVASAALVFAGVNVRRLRLLLESHCRDMLATLASVNEVLNAAQGIAHERRDAYIGTEHILLAIAREQCDVLARVFNATGIDLNCIDAAVRNLSSPKSVPHKEVTYGLSKPVILDAASNNPYHPPSTHAECFVCGYLVSTAQQDRPCEKCGACSWCAVGSVPDEQKATQSSVRSLFEMIRAHSSPQHELFQRLVRSLSLVFFAKGAVVWRVVPTTAPIAVETADPRRYQELVSTLENVHASHHLADDDAVHLFQGFDLDGSKLLHVIQRPSISEHVIDGNQLLLRLVAKALEMR